MMLMVLVAFFIVDVSLFLLLVRLSPSTKTARVQKGTHLGRRRPAEREGALHGYFVKEVSLNEETRESKGCRRRRSLLSRRRKGSKKRKRMKSPSAFNVAFHFAQRATAKSEKKKSKD